MMRLYSSPTTPFGRTVEIVARELGLEEDIDFVTVAVRPTSPNEEFAAVNPLRRIPALEIEGGEVLIDSSVVAAYLAARVGDTALFAEGSPERWRIASRYAVARGAAECAVAARYEATLRPEGLRWSEWSDDLVDKVLSALAYFEADPPRPAGRLTIADIALGVLLGYLDFRYADLRWRDRFPALAAFMASAEQRPSFQATVPS